MHTHTTISDVDVKVHYTISRHFGTLAAIKLVVNPVLVSHQSVVTLQLLQNYKVLRQYRTDLTHLINDTNSNIV